MLDLLVIADDFTGALDTGIQFADAGLNTIVITGRKISDDIMEKYQTIVVNTNTRHLPSCEAYRIVFDVVKHAMEKGVAHIYKKTDSGLRGNIGAELTSVLDASGEKYLPFVPAYPELNRTTMRGVQYIENCPVAESVFGKDPFDPVHFSYIPDIIHQQCSTEVQVIPAGAAREDLPIPCIAVYDACSVMEEKRIAQQLFEDKLLRVTAGCAGFASVLTSHLKREKLCAKNHDIHSNKLIVFNSSLNQITLSQIRAARGKGWQYISLSPEEKIDNEYWNSASGEKRLQMILDECRASDACIIDGAGTENEQEVNTCAEKMKIDAGEIQKRIPSALGKIANNMLGVLDFVMMVIGGDTLLGILDELKITTVTPLTEVYPGVVMASFEKNGRTCCLISKSGGIGGEDVLLDVAGKVIKGKG